MNLKSMQALLDQPPPVDAPKMEVVHVAKEVVREPVSASVSDDVEYFYLYPYKSKFEAAKDLKEFYDKINLPDTIGFKCSKIKKDFITKSFELVKKYWKDETYVFNRLADLKTLKEYL